MKSAFPTNSAMVGNTFETVMGHFRELDGEGVVVAGVSQFENICDEVAFKDGGGNFTFRVKTVYTEGMLGYTSLKTERAFVSEQTQLGEYPAYDQCFGH